MTVYTIISVLIAIAAILLVLIVLVQNSKGGGLASNFQASNQVMGVRKTTDFLEKSTWTLSIAILVLAVAAAWAIPHGQTAADSDLQDRIENTVDPNTIPAFPTETPAETPAADDAE